MKTIEELIADIKDEDIRQMAELYVPVIRRRVAESGWNIVRRWLYVRPDKQWYRELLENMTAREQMAEDQRRMRILVKMSIDNAAEIRRERTLIQALITTVITQLMGTG